MSKQPTGDASKPKRSFVRYLFLVLLIVLTGSSATLAVFLPSDKEQLAQLKDHVLVAQLCQRINCAWLEKKTLSAPGLIDLHGVMLRAIDESQLMLNVTLVNTASRAQLYPDLAVNFFNASGQPMTTQRIKTVRYLGDRSKTFEMASRQPITVSLTLAQPPKQAVYYSVQVLASDQSQVLPPG